MKLILLHFGAALAQAPAGLIDAGQAAPEARPALLVLTPGVATDAYIPWINAVESAGLDAWTLEISPGEPSVDAVVLRVREAFTALAQDRQTPVVLAHGYGGVFVLLAGLEPARMALIATPLAAQPIAVRVQPELGAQATGLPWDPELLGSLPTASYAGALGRTYADWAVQFPAYNPPSCPTLLVASTRDPVAPPEVVRLPSQSWPDRTWVRPGPLRYDAKDPTHAELLSDPAIAKLAAKFLAEEP